VTSLTLLAEQKLTNEHCKTGMSDWHSDPASLAVTSLMGSLPPYEFDTRMTTTGDKLAALMLQLQMTGYMLRNAEYVLTLRRILRLKTRSAEEFRAAFDRVDLDNSGYIEMSEVEELLQQVYEDDVPPFEISSFLSLFDADGDGRISWEEFASTLGADSESNERNGSTLPALPAPEEVSLQPKLSGTIKVQLDDGTEVRHDFTAGPQPLAQLCCPTVPLGVAAQLCRLASPLLSVKTTRLHATLTAYCSCIGLVNHPERWTWTQTTTWIS